MRSCRSCPSLDAGYCTFKQNSLNSMSQVIGKDAKLALQATQMFLEISGNDMRTLIAKEDRKIQRERLKMEREQMEKESQPESEGAKIIFGADGGIEVDDGL